MMPIKSRLIATALISAAILTSCGSMRNTATVHRTSPTGPSKVNLQVMEISSNLHPHSHALLTEAKQWLGTPYKYGGEDKGGVDCSGLVLNIYRSALDIKLPRSSSEQAKFCSPLAKGDLMPGDLLFFATSGSRNKVSHVGIYIGDGRMIHSSSSKGVIISGIDEDYFRKTFTGAGYVEQYHAMLDKSSIKKDSNVPRPKDSSSESATYKMTPVASLPKRKQGATPATKTPSATKTSDKKTDEPTPDEARRAVLNSLIEQKIDSIFNRK